MGIQIQCAECHVHPQVDKWSQKDFWGMAAFFAHIVADRETDEKGRPMPGTATLHEVEKKAAPRPQVAKKTGEKEIKPGGTIAIPDPTDNKKIGRIGQGQVLRSAMPALQVGPVSAGAGELGHVQPGQVFRGQRRQSALGAPVRSRAGSADRRHARRQQGVAPGHSQDAQRSFVKNGYDPKFVLRALCNTQAYQRTSRPLPENADAEEKLFARMPVKVVGAHELLASLVTVTGYREANARDRAADAADERQSEAAAGTGDARPASSTPASTTTT